MIRKLILKWLRLDEQPFIKGDGKSCMLIKDDKFIQLAMPDGVIIPMQKDLTIINNTDQKGLCIVQVTVQIPLNADMPNLHYYINE